MTLAYKSSPFVYGGGLVIGVVRFATFVPITVYKGFAGGHRTLILNHPELHSGIYGTRWAAGETLVYKWATFAFYWNFIVWIPAIIAPGPGALIFGVVDIVIAVMITISTKFQAGYSPHIIGRCSGTGAQDWQLPPDANESFFEVSARLNATVTTGFKVCKAYVQEWQCGVALSALYFLLAFISIIVCCSACCYQCRESKKKGQSFTKWLWESVVLFPAVIGGIVWYILYYIPAIFFRYLPIKVIAKTRYARRYTAKAGLRAAEATEVRLEKLAKKAPLRKRDVGTQYRGGLPGKPVEVSEFLGIYDMLMLVVEDLHYIDILNLSITSKSMRESILPTEDYQNRLKHFRMYTCDSGSKTQCWVCTNQICNSCNTTHKILQTTPYHHLDSCRPNCTPCYKALHVSPRRNSKSPVCDCAPLPSALNIYQRILHSANFYGSKQISLAHVNRTVCKQCKDLTEKDVLKIRAKRTACELREKGRGGGKCGKCKGELGGGPRWWICGRCGLECKALCHGAWGRKEKGVRDEVVGEEAV